jgi:hypothetical protein
MSELINGLNKVLHMKEKKSTLTLPVAFLYGIFLSGLFMQATSQTQDLRTKAEVVHLTNSSATKPSDEEMAIEKARSATQAIVDTMPDFIAEELVVRSYALGTRRDWVVKDRLKISVTYQSDVGEQYKLLSINDNPAIVQQDYDDMGGLTTTGEFVSCLSDLFSPYSKARFRRIGKEYIRGKEALVYEFKVDVKFSQLKVQNSHSRTFTAGYSGKIWIDSTAYQVLRYEEQVAEVPRDINFSGYKIIDYDFVKIGENQYLLPSTVTVETSSGIRDQTIQARNEIRFKDYRKYGAELKIIDEDQ